MGTQYSETSWLGIHTNPKIQADKDKPLRATEPA